MYILMINSQLHHYGFKLEKHNKDFIKMQSSGRINQEYNIIQSE